MFPGCPWLPPPHPVQILSEEGACMKATGRTSAAAWPSQRGSFCHYSFSLLVLSLSRYLCSQGRRVWMSLSPKPRGIFIKYRLPGPNPQFRVSVSSRPCQTSHWSREAPQTGGHLLADVFVSSSSCHLWAMVTEELFPFLFILFFCSKHPCNEHLSSYKMVSFFPPSLLQIKGLFL